MCHKHAHTLAPLKKLCLTKVKLISTDKENDAFIDMNKIVVRDVLLSYTNFNER